MLAQASSPRSSLLPQVAERFLSKKLWQRDLTVLEAVEDEFDARGYAQLVKYVKEVVPNDLLATRGWAPRKISLVSCAITALLGGIGWVGLRLQPIYFLVLAGATFAILFGIALRLGSLQMYAPTPHPAIKPASLKESPQPQLDSAISPCETADAVNECEVAT